MNRPKSIGTAAETRAVRWFRTAGFPGADRQPLRGNRDTGDLNLAPGIVAEIKAHKLPTGHPTPAQIVAWMAQAAAERVNADATHCPLIVKRPGTTDVARWYAFITFADLATLTGGYIPTSLDPQPVTMPVAALATILRAAGYGTPLDQETP